MAATTGTSTGMPSVWPTPMLVAGNGHQTLAYASFISAEIISSKTRQEVYEVSCAASQCNGTALPKQTVTQAFEVYVCPGDDPICSDVDDDTPTMTQFGYPLGWSGEAVVDGTTTDWALKLSVLKDNERSSGATGQDTVTYMATTKVGDDVKESTSTVAVFDETNACLIYDNYAFVSVTAGVEKLLKDYPPYLYDGGNELLSAEDFVPLFVSQREVCAKATSGLAKGSGGGGGGGASQTDKESAGPRETGSSGNKDNAGGGDDNASGKTALSFVLMGALLAVSVLIP
ncbi:hypothetical protein NLU13_0136 [Sarocladium strictum]|uniref:Uncharacterized protein n=1 Tax=Sarocladium strictum TaxID=5046 RepID=A0AA39LB00_SARSR|nr:hypothetical protein NLU13_0136 [Sarocladium strictum]